MSTQSDPSRRGFFGSLIAGVAALKGADALAAAEPGTSSPSPLQSCSYEAPLGSPESLVFTTVYDYEGNIRGHYDAPAPEFFGNPAQPG